MRDVQSPLEAAGPFLNVERDLTGRCADATGGSRSLLECWPALQRLDKQDLGQHPVTLKPNLASLMQPPPLCRGGQLQNTS